MKYLKRSLVLVACCSFLLCLAGIARADAPTPKDEKKHTTAGKYSTAAETYEMWKATPEKIKIVDVRTPEEYAFIGHAPMAHNIPVKNWTGKWDAEKKEYILEDNPEFEATAKKLFKTDDLILVMCRSGHRSAAGVNRLTKAGFTNVYNIVDGFEGDKVTDEESYFKGKRMVNGWKNSGAPWTNDLKAELIYNPAK